MKPGYLVYEHRILVDLDDEEMVCLAEKDIMKGIEDDIEMGQVEDNIESEELTSQEISRFGLAKIKKSIRKNFEELHQNHSDEDAEE